MVSCGSGVAVGFDLTRVAMNATLKARENLGGLTPDLACVFVHGALADDVTAALTAACQTAGATATIGCSASQGVIGGGHGIEDVPAVSVLLASIPSVRLKAFHLEVMRTSESIAVVGMPSLDGEDQLGIVMADAYSFPIEGFVEESDTVLSGLPLAGGVAVGGQGPGSTRLLIDGRVVDRGAVGIVIGGGVEVSVFVSQGCRPVGNPMTITKCEGNVLLELAGRPALQRLEDLLLMLSPEEQAIATTGLTIGVARDEYRDEMAQGDFIVRNLVRIDKDRRTLVVADLFEVGQTVQFQLRDAAAATTDLSDVITRWRARQEIVHPSGALLFSCNGRGERFFSTSDHDVAVVSDGLDGVDVAGYFAAGEIGPIGGRNYLHGFSASVVAFGGSQPVGRAVPGGPGSTD